jgi:hypothetical protein
MARKTPEGRWERRVSFLLLAAIVSVVVACFGWYSGPGSLQNAAAAASDTSYVRIIHASPFVGTADVFVDGKPFLNSFAFGSVTNYVPLPAGPHKVQIALVGKGINASALTKTLPVGTGKTYTVAAVGATAQTLNLQVFVDNNQVIANHTKVRIYHLIPDAGSVNVLLGGDTPINAISYQDDSNYLTMDSGPCSVHLSAPSINQSINGTEQFSVNAVASIFAIGTFTSTPKVQLVFAETPGIPGLPQTGSDPVAADPTHPQSTLWLSIMLTLIIAGIGITGVARYTHQQRLQR